MFFVVSFFVFGASVHKTTHSMRRSAVLCRHSADVNTRHRGKEGKGEKDHAVRHRRVSVTVCRHCGCSAAVNAVVFGTDTQCTAVSRLSPSEHCKSRRNPHKRHRNTAKVQAVNGEGWTAAFVAPFRATQGPTLPETGNIGRATSMPSCVCPWNAQKPADSAATRHRPPRSSSAERHARPAAFGRTQRPLCTTASAQLMKTRVRHTIPAENTHQWHRCDHAWTCCVCALSTLGFRPRLSPKG